MTIESKLRRKINATSDFKHELSIFEILETQFIFLATFFSLSQKCCVMREKDQARLWLIFVTILSASLQVLASYKLRSSKMLGLVCLETFGAHVELDSWFRRSRGWNFSSQNISAEKIRFMLWWKLSSLKCILFASPAEEVHLMTINRTWI